MQRSVWFLLLSTILGCSGSPSGSTAAPPDPNAPPVPRFEPRQRFPAHPAENRPLAFSPDSRYLATRSPRGGFQIWDIEQSRVLQSFEESKRRITSMAFSADGRQLFADDPFTEGTGVWDVSTGKKLRAFAGAGLNLALSADGTLLAGGSSLGAIYLWDVRSGDERGRMRGHSEEPACLAFTPQGDWLASGGRDGTVRLWEVQEARQSRLLSGHKGIVHAAAFSRDGRRLATAGQDKVVFVWDVPGGNRLQALSGHRGEIRGVTFSQDGRLLISAGLDDTLRIWDPATGKELRTLPAELGGVQTVALSPDGRRFAATGKSDVRVWELVP
jgi:WD40 repeat protein